MTRLRLTNLPVALTVSHGNHGWILTGFRATADPAKTSSFTVTSVRVTGPLYGLQSKNGYDMAPNTKLTTAQLKRFFTPWKYAPRAMIWDGRYVSIQPVPVKASAAGAARRAVAGRQRCTERRRESGAGRDTQPESGGARRRHPWRRLSRCLPANALLDPDAVAAADPVRTTEAFQAPLGVVVASGLALVAIAGLLALRMRRGRSSPSRSGRRSSRSGR